MVSEESKSKQYSLSYDYTSYTCTIEQKAETISITLKNGDALTGDSELSLNQFNYSNSIPSVKTLDDIYKLLTSVNEKQITMKFIIDQIDLVFSIDIQGQAKEVKFALKRYTGVNDLIDELKKINDKLGDLEYRISSIESDKERDRANTAMGIPTKGDKVPNLTEEETKILFSLINYDRKKYLSLVFNPLPGQDTISKMLCSLSDKKPLLFIIETTDGCKYGGYWHVLSDYDGVIAYDVFLMSFNRNSVFPVNTQNKKSLVLSAILYDLLYLQDGFMKKPISLAGGDIFNCGQALKAYNNGKDSFTVKKLYVYEVKTDS